MQYPDEKSRGILFIWKFFHDRRQPFFPFIISLGRRGSICCIWSLQPSLSDGKIITSYLISCLIWIYNLSRCITSYPKMFYGSQKFTYYLQPYEITVLRFKAYQLMPFSCLISNTLKLGRLENKTFVFMPFLNGYASHTLIWHYVG